MEDFDDIWMMLDECGFIPATVTNKKSYNDGYTELEIYVKNKIDVMKDEIAYVQRFFQQKYDIVNVLEWKT